MRITKALPALVLLLALVAGTASAYISENPRQGLAPISAERRPELTPREPGMVLGFELRFLGFCVRSGLIYTDPSGKIFGLLIPIGIWIGEEFAATLNELGIATVQTAEADYVETQIKVQKLILELRNGPKSGEPKVCKVLTDLEKLQAELDRQKQLHHFATNKSKTWTPQMEEIARKYGLDLDGDWNKELIEHMGRHPDAYHDFVLQGMRRAERESYGNLSKFLELFEKYVKEPIRNNPDLLRKIGWE